MRRASDKDVERFRPVGVALAVSGRRSGWRSRGALAVLVRQRGGGLDRLDRDDIKVCDVVFDDEATLTLSVAPSPSGIPPELPYVLMFDDDCGGNTESCLPPHRAPVPGLVAVARDRFILAKGAGHDNFLTEPALVRRTVDELLEGS